MKARKGASPRQSGTNGGRKNGNGSSDVTGSQNLTAVDWIQTCGLDDRIFVQVASYRDPDCQWTLKDMFDKAANPDRVFAGVVWQFIKGEDDHCFLLETRPAQVRQKLINARFSKGVCWARAQTQQLWQGEEFTLQIDSHTRFEPGWDEKLIRMCRQTSSAKPVITGYPPAYTPPDTLHQGTIFSMGAKEFDRDGILTMEGKAIRVEDAPPLPIRGVFCGAGFLFAPATIIQEVPYDPHLYFFGEEITLAVRLWTHGWDLFYPNMPVLYTNWDRQYRQTHFDDHPDWPALNRTSQGRVHYLLAAEEPKQVEALREIDKYGLGKVRSLEEYQRYSGVNFAKRILSPKAKQGKPYPPFHFNGTEASDHGPAIISSHQPRKIFESELGIVFDEFLPEETYEKIYHYACISDYERINTTGQVKKVWRIRDGFPLRSTLNLFYFADQAQCPSPKPDWAFPTNTALDLFAQQLYRFAPQAAKHIGLANQHWDRFSATAWIYPRDTALSLHDDGSGVYSGAFTYFLNPNWDIHWGGLLLFIDARSSQALQAFKTPQNVRDYYRGKWIEPVENSFVWEPGLAQCIFPKRNRIVFIHPEAYHLVTKVYADAGDNARMSLAGFFQKRKNQCSDKPV